MNILKFLPLRGITRRVKKLIDIKKILQVVLVTMFFALFLNNLTPVAFAQYDVGGYGSYGDVGGYGSYGDVGGYSYPSIGYGYYSYPSISYPGTYNYPAISYGTYTYPPVSIPGTTNYPVTPYGTYTYPPVSIPGTTNYPVASNGAYTYPQLTYPGTYNYPAASYFGGYNYPSSVAYAATIPYAATTAYAATVPTGPEGTLPWILLGGLMLSVVVYLILFRIRFKGQSTLAGAYRNAMLERRIRKIKKRELKPDTSYDFQS